ncbi:MAG: DUF58 domain-containing protein [Lachnospiraceae bacterium]|nr:DUF58 domain-containing protein [Lachnospiraceae bacterium]
MLKSKYRKLILLVLFILSLILISIFGGVISYSLFFAVLIIPLISLMYLIYVYYSFTIYQEIKTRNIVAGELVPYSFILKNEGFTVFTALNIKVYSDFSNVTDVPDDQVFRLFPGEKIEYKTTLRCRYRGEYKVGVNRLVITDFLELFRFSYKMMSKLDAIVKPRIVALDIQNEIPDLDVFIHSNFKKDINEPDLVVRDYVAGDPLKKIHWKSTARSLKLKVRNDIGVLKEKVLLIADFERVSNDMREYLPLENKILEQTIGLLYHFVIGKMSIELVFNQDKLQNALISDIVQFNSIYEELASISFRSNNRFLNLYNDVYRRGLISGAQIVLMVVHYMDDDLFAEVARLSLTSKIAVVYVVSEEDISEYSRQSTERFKIVKVGYEESEEFI